jgi:hypothetical protein
VNTLKAMKDYGYDPKKISADIEEAQNYERERKALFVALEEPLSEVFLI